jgi:peptidoglycan/xylan/chitin deacetylase (PgdA/CDA1 family)
MYHRIANDGPQELTPYRVGTDAFAEQLSWLRRHGYHAICADKLSWHLEGAHPFPGRPVMITFDDAYQDFADMAWPALRRHDFNAEVFVVTDLAGGFAEWDRSFGEPARLMSADTIAALAGQGARFGSHLATHRRADGLTTAELAQELLRWTGLAPRALAAPYGVTDARLRQLAADCGYRIGLSTQAGAAALGADPLNLPRIEVRGDMAIDEFASVLEAAR